jgi:AraC-like DNA-binding protein
MAIFSHYTPRPVSLTPESKLQTLVENRSVFSMDHCELNIFETYKQSNRISLKFPDLVYTAMLRGKKVMNLDGRTPFDYLPGESVIVSSNEEMIIDFPEATRESPTQCIALAINGEKIKSTIDFLNERFAKTESHEEWKLETEHVHIQNTLEIRNTVERLIRISQETNVAKDVFADMALQELLLRIMQTQARELIFENYVLCRSNNRFAHVVGFIKENLAENLTVEKLSSVACMSKPHFFRSFKREFGISPVEFIIQERIKLAKKLLIDPGVSIAEAGFRSGFQNVSYFSNIFKKNEGTTPKEFRKSNFFGIS